jgi:hypothetical protein
MPRVVPCWRTYQKDIPGKLGTKETVVEKLMMLEPDANEAVRNGKGEWSRQEPKGGIAVTELESRVMTAESETRPEKVKDRRGFTP